MFTVGPSRSHNVSTGSGSLPWDPESEGSDRWQSIHILSLVLQFLYDRRFSASVALHAILNKWFGDKVPRSKPGEQKSLASRVEPGWTKGPRPVKSPEDAIAVIFRTGSGDRLTSRCCREITLAVLLFISTRNWSESAANSGVLLSAQSGCSAALRIDAQERSLGRDHHSMDGGLRS